nr:hypothetical protein [Pseudoduganella lutea]
MARDRNRQTCEFVTGQGPVSASQLSEHLKPVLAPDILLISEAVNVKAGIRARGAIHIQGVNAWHSRFKTWLRRFNGVASRYLAHYTGWLCVLDTAALTTPPQWLRVAVASG